MMQGEARAQESLQDGKVILDSDRLKALRKQRGLSQDALAQVCLEHRLCVSIASIKRAETGKPVLYRTASHLARVYMLPLEQLVQPAPGHGPSLEAPDPFLADEQRQVLELVLLLGAPLSPALDAQAADIIAQYGGHAQPGQLAIFGLPRSYGSDAIRCLQCASALGLLLHGCCAALVVRRRLWPNVAGAGACPSLPTLLPLLPLLPSPPAATAAPQSPSEDVYVYVERALSVQVAERFVFAPLDYAGNVLRLAHERQSLQIAQYPLIGRHVEVQQFKALLETTLAYQCGHILYLRGVAGIGKSCLIQELSHIAQQNQFACHCAVVLDFGVQGDATPLAQLVRSLLGLPATAVSEAQLALQMQRSRLSEEHAMHFRTILAMAQPPAASVLFGAMAHHTRALRQAEAIRDLMLRKAVECPLLLVLEDIHWSAPELMACLVALLPEVQEAPIIWLLSSRFEQDPLEQALRPHLNGLPVTIFDLATLRSADARALARHASDTDPDFQAQCVARAQGNPLFLTQLLLAGRTHTLPGSLANLVQTKLDLLAPDQRRAMRVASAIGHDFSLAFLRDVLQQSEHEVLDCVRHYIIRPIAHHSAEGGNYGFVHDLVMQGIYESIAPEQRAEIHVRLARRYGDQEPQLRARHLHKACHADAPAALLEVVAASIGSYQYPLALELIGLCQRCDYAARDEYQLQLLSGQCHAKMGQTQRARLAFSAALELAQGQSQKVAAVIGLASALNVLEELGKEAALLDEAIQAAQAAGVEVGLAELYYLKGNMYFPAGNFAMSRQLHEQAQRHARSKDIEARALSGIGDSYYAQGRIVTAHRVFLACLALCETHQLADIEASNRFMLGTTRIYLNRTTAALDDALASAELGAKVGNRRAEIVSRLTAGWALLSAGRAPDARSQVEQGLALARKIGASRFEPFLNESLVRVLLLEGKRDDAYELALQAWDMVERLKLHKFIGPWVLSTLALAAPDLPASLHALQQGQVLLDEGCVAHNAYRFHVSAIESALLHDRIAEVRALAARFALLVQEEPFPWASHHIALARCSANWLEHATAAHEACLLGIMREARAAGLDWVMPLWRQRLGQMLCLD
ncbi:MAG: AAA family ATPase [Massilia sp.]|nr:AAA family ATPase [Massilia sp.]